MILLIYIHIPASQNFDGFMHPKEIVRTIKAHGQIGAAITDHGTFAGAIQFIKACRAEDIKCVVGIESYLCRDHKVHSKDGQPDGRKGNRHINLFAKNMQGYKNICTLSQTAFLDGFYYDPRIDIELLAKHSEGVICSTACLSGIVNWNLRTGRHEEAKKAASIFKDIFADDFLSGIIFASSSIPWYMTSR